MVVTIENRAYGGGVGNGRFSYPPSVSEWGTRTRRRETRGGTRNSKKKDSGACTGGNYTIPKKKNSKKNDENIPLVHTSE